MNPLNSPLEVGVRVLVLLSQAFPESLDVATLVWLDHAMLHSGELGGPPSLHPDLPAGPGELGMKRRLVEEGMTVLMRAGLASVVATANGLEYRASEEGPGFVGVLEAPYVRRLTERAEWIMTAHAPDLDVREATQRITERWSKRLDGGTQTRGGDHG